MNNNATSSYSNSISAISMDNNMPEYSFGVTRSNKLVSYLRFVLEYL